MSLRAAVFWYVSTGETLKSIFFYQSVLCTLKLVFSVGQVKSGLVYLVDYNYVCLS